MSKKKKTWAGVEIVESDWAKDNELREISKNLVERVYMLEQETRQRGKLEAQHANMIMELMERMDKLEELIRYATGPCNACNGTGMIYIGSETEGRSLPDPCDHCRGTGKTPLDIESMMEKFKEEARKEVSQNHDLITGEEIPF
tara:strand:- start:45 stop:476 length:432 start_codon:yes stop_codon:yes gene_type:complete